MPGINNARIRKTQLNTTELIKTKREKTGNCPRQKKINKFIPKSAWYITEIGLILFFLAMQVHPKNIKKQQNGLL